MPSQFPKLMCLRAAGKLSPVDQLYNSGGSFSFSFFYFYLYAFFCVYGCVGVCSVYVDALGSQKRAWNPGSWRNRWLWASDMTWVLGAKPRSCGRAVSWTATHLSSPCAALSISAMTETHSSALCINCLLLSGSLLFIKQHFVYSPTYWKMLGLFPFLSYEYSWY